MRSYNLLCTTYLMTNDDHDDIHACLAASDGETRVAGERSKYEGSVGDPRIYTLSDIIVWRSTTLSLIMTVC